jgi:hypothetical protein
VVLHAPPSFTLKLLIMPTEFIFMFLMFLTINRDYFTELHFCILFRINSLFRGLNKNYTGSGIHISSYSVNIWGDFLGLKRLGSEAHDTPLSSVEIKNIWSYTSALP